MTSNSMTISHHPDDSTLMCFAAGSLPGALAALVACHCNLCARCAGDVRRLERIGGAMLDRLQPAPVVRRAPTAALRSLEAEVVTADPPRAQVHGSIPAPLAQLVGPSVEHVAWKRLGLGVWHRPIDWGGKGDLRLLKVAPGQAMPEHGHGGCELTLMLAGSYRDEIGTFSRGDVADLDETVEHRPVADPETGCICLIASEQPARFKGLVGRLLQPWTRL